MMPNSPHPIFDFHSHSTASDGTLTPSQLVELAAEKGVEWLALTDHDTHAGLPEAGQACRQHGVRLLPGAEWSLQHEQRDYHVLGLNVDPENAAICELEASQMAARKRRAQSIGQRLNQAASLTDSYQQACELAASEAPGRPWFARVLIANGKARDMQHAFNRFLKKGQSAFVATPWADFHQGIAAICAAGGVAVLAHPQHYKLTRTKLRRLLAEFKDAEGEGMEVALPNLTGQQTRLLSESCADFELFASGGSDFHSPEQHWLTLGKLPPLAPSLRPLWSAFGDGVEERQ